MGGRWGGDWHSGTQSQKAACGCPPPGGMVLQTWLSLARPLCQEGGGFPQGRRERPHGQPTEPHRGKQPLPPDSTSQVTAVTAAKGTPPWGGHPACPHAKGAPSQGGAPCLSSWPQLPLPIGGAHPSRPPSLKSTYGSPSPREKARRELGLNPDQGHPTRGDSVSLKPGQGGGGGDGGEL